MLKLILPWDDVCVGATLCAGRIEVSRCFQDKRCHSIPTKALKFHRLNVMSIIGGGISMATPGQTIREGRMCQRKDAGWECVGSQSRLLI